MELEGARVTITLDADGVPVEMNTPARGNYNQATKQMVYQPWRAFYSRTNASVPNVNYGTVGYVAADGTFEPCKKQEEEVALTLQEMKKRT